MGSQSLSKRIASGCWILRRRHGMGPGISTTQVSLSSLGIIVFVRIDSVSSRVLRLVVSFWLVAATEWAKGVSKPNCECQAFGLFCCLDLHEVSSGVLRLGRVRLKKKGSLSSLGFFGFVWIYYVSPSIWRLVVGFWLHGMGRGRLKNKLSLSNLGLFFFVWINQVSPSVLVLVACFWHVAAMEWPEAVSQNKMSLSSIGFLVFNLFIGFSTHIASG